MKFGFYSQLMDPNLTRAYSDQLDELREQVVFCEQAGFDIAWVDEHHFNVAFADSPNPIVPGSMLAAHTSRIRIGMLVISALWHPLRLAEDVALLDHLSKGRVEVAMGRGSNPSDVANLNPLLTGVWPDLNARFEQSVQTASREVYAEVVEILKKAWTERFFFHKGRYFEFPQPGFPGGAPTVPQDPTAVRDGEIVKDMLEPQALSKAPSSPPNANDLGTIFYRGGRIGHNGLGRSPATEEVAPETRSICQYTHRARGATVQGGRGCGRLADGLCRALI